MELILKIVNRLPSWLRKRLFVSIALATRPMTLGARIVVTNSDGHILLLKHTYIAGWHLPGGGVERGETLHQSASKELLEECSISNTAPMKLFHIYKNANTSSLDHVALFVCGEWKQANDWKANHEIAELEFFSLEQLPESTTTQTRARLAEVFQQQPVRDVW